MLLAAVVVTREKSGIRVGPQVHSGLKHSGSLLQTLPKGGGASDLCGSPSSRETPDETAFALVAPRQGTLPEEGGAAASLAPLLWGELIMRTLRTLGRTP